MMSRIAFAFVVVSVGERAHREAIDVVAESPRQERAERESLIADRRIEAKKEVGIRISDDSPVQSGDLAVIVEILVYYQPESS